MFFIQKADLINLSHATGDHLYISLYLRTRSRIRKREAGNKRGGVNISRARIQRPAVPRFMLPSEMTFLFLSRARHISHAEHKTQLSAAAMR